MAKVRAYSAHLDLEIASKNCGTGSGGFTAGNTCGRGGGGGGGNSAEGSKRRQAAGKKRKRRGPDRGIGARTRAAQRKRAGHQNASRRKWREELQKPTGSPEGRQLYRSQAGERKDLADAFRAERKGQAKEKQADFKSTAKEIKSERKELAKDQHKERVTLKKEQAREIAKVDRQAEKDHSRLDAKYEAAKATAKNPEKLEQAYQERKRDLDATRAESKSDLDGEHRQARLDMKLAQKAEREQSRDGHRSQAEDIRKDWRGVTNDQHMGQREQIHDLKSSHRAERAELAREIRDSGWKAFSFIDVKAARDDPKAIVQLTELRDRLVAAKNCGTGAGGFQAGNQCGRGGGVARSPEQKERTRKRFHGKLRKEFPFLKGKDIGNLTEARGDRASSAALPRNQITAHEHDTLHGTLSDPGNGIRKPREIHSVDSESKKWHLSATVSTNPLHGVMAGEKKYKVEYSAEGPNHQGHDYADHFNSRSKALAAAEKGHAELAKEYAPHLAPKAGPKVKELFQKAGTTPARMDRLIYKQETPWHDVPRDQRVAWLANERAKIKNASKSAGKGEIRKGPHGAPIAWHEVDTRIAGGKVRWSEWTAADERATTGDAKGLLAVVGKAASEDEPSGVPDAQSILDAVLDELGYAEAWADGSLDVDTHVELLHLVRMEGRRWFREQAQAVLDGLAGDGEKALFGSIKAKVSEFFGRAKKYVRELFVAGVMAVAGPAPMDAAELRALDAEVTEQHAYLQAFEKELVEGNKPPNATPRPATPAGRPTTELVQQNKPLDGTFVARAEKYGASVWGSAQEILRAGAKAERHYTSERRIHQAHDKPCEVCLEEMLKEWQPIGTLRRIGDSPCMMNCHCIFIYGFGENNSALALEDGSKSFDWDSKAYVPCRDARGRFYRLA